MKSYLITWNTCFRCGICPWSCDMNPVYSTELSSYCQEGIYYYFEYIMQFSGYILWKTYQSTWKSYVLHLLTNKFHIFTFAYLPRCQHWSLLPIFLSMIISLCHIFKPSYYIVIIICLMQKSHSFVPRDISLQLIVQLLPCFWCYFNAQYSSWCVYI